MKAIVFVGLLFLAVTTLTIQAQVCGGGGAVSKSTIMPPFGKTLTEAEIKDLTAHLRKLCKCKGK